MADISRSLEQLVSISDQRVKIEQYKTALTGYLSAPADTASLQAFVEHVAGEAVPLSVSRVVLLELAQKLPSLPAAQRKTIGLHVIDRTAARATSFEEAVSTIREHIAGVYEEEEEWSEAARMLSAIPLDSGIRQLSNDYKVEKYIKIAMLFLQAEDRPRLSPPRLLASSPPRLASSPPRLASWHPPSLPHRTTSRSTQSSASTRRPCCSMPRRPTRRQKPLQHDSALRPSPEPPSLPTGAHAAAQGLLRAHPRRQAKVPRGAAPSHFPDASRHVRDGSLSVCPQAATRFHQLSTMQTTAFGARLGGASGRRAL